jgi:hypothetical protein
MNKLPDSTVSYTFPDAPGLDGVRTGIFLDSRGAKLTVVGIVPCRCHCHDVKVVIQYVMKGRGNEDPLRLGLVERMIRGSCPRSQSDAAQAARLMTTLLVNDYLNRTDSCRKVA